jgi:3',5'-cyclic AMP phosphodiesterase CpdA
MIAPKYFKVDGTMFSAASDLKDNETYFCTFDIAVDGTVIEISANSFPGTYYVTGDTYARSQTTGKDEFFQLIIPKAKVQSENTITMEAEGDPSVFNMSLRVLRSDNGELMKLVKYNLHEDYKASTNSTVASDIYHNHDLTGKATTAQVSG